MASTSRINIISKLPREFNSNFTVDNVTYHAQTEDMAKLRKAVTRIYLKGEVVFSKETGYAHIAKLADFEAKRSDLIENQHKATIGLFLKEQKQKQKLKPAFFKEVQLLLKQGKGKSAIASLREAIEKFPTDPFLLSYYGCLLAVVENNPKEGIKVCKDAIVRLKGSMPFGSEFFYPAFYLNLGRAYLKNGNKEEAIEAFNEGLGADPENHDILWEMRKLGNRKKPPVAFLKRSNPINKYIGMILSKASK
jgi:tetratricopeptide (TPR) repeat protein